MTRGVNKTIDSITCLVTAGKAKGSEKVKDVVDTDRLDELAKPLVEYLAENCHPHSAIVITAERTAVIETVLSIPQKEIS